MKRRPPRNVPASVRQRLLRIAQERGERFERLLQRYAIERFLFRVGSSPHRARLVLKGATLLAVLGENRYRPTRDLDLLGLGPGSPEEVRRLVSDVCALASDPDDGLLFRTETMVVEPIREADEYGGQRVRLRCALGNADIPIQIDIGFGDSVHPGPVEIEYPTLLDFPRPHIRAYPMETVVAEKLEAIVRLGLVNGRVKDFHDLHTIAGSVAFDGRVLAEAVRATFARRGTAVPEEVPPGLSPAWFSDAGIDALWRAFQRDRLLQDSPGGFRGIGDALRAFLLPVLAAARMAGEPVSLGRWTSETGWSSPI